MPQIDIQTTLGQPKSIEELTPKLTIILQDLLNNIQSFPFKIRTNPNEPLPKETKDGTIIFDVDNNNKLQIGIKFGDTVIYKT